MSKTYVLKSDAERGVVSISDNDKLAIKYLNFNVLMKYRFFQIEKKTLENGNSFIGIKADERLPFPKSMSIEEFYLFDEINCMRKGFCDITDFREREKILKLYPEFNCFDSIETAYFNNYMAMLNVCAIPIKQLKTQIETEAYSFVLDIKEAYFYQYLGAKMLSIKTPQDALRWLNNGIIDTPIASVFCDKFEKSPYFKKRSQYKLNIYNYLEKLIK